MGKRKTAPKSRVKRTPTKRRPVTTKFLDAFADAWNRHDVDGLMTFMSGRLPLRGERGPRGLRHPIRRARAGAQRLCRRVRDVSRRQVVSCAPYHQRESGCVGVDVQRNSGKRHTGGGDGMRPVYLQEWQDRREKLVPKEPDGLGFRGVKPVHEIGLTVPPSLLQRADQVIE